MRSFGEKPILPSRPMRIAVSADFSLSACHAVINVAVISTRNLSALVSQKARACMSRHMDATGGVRRLGGSGSGVDTSGSFFRSLSLLGWFLNAPRKASSAVGVLGLAMESEIL